MHTSNWDDLRYALAVAEFGSVKRAARHLGVNHATVLRRMAAFETTHGIQFFERTRSGYAVSADRRDLLERMRAAGAAMDEVARHADAIRPSASSAIRVTSTDSLTQIVLPPLFAEIAQEGGPSIDLQSTNAHLDFDRLEAEITIRPAVTLPTSLTGDRAAALEFAVYGRDDATAWLGLSGPLARTTAADWMRSEGHAEHVSISADSFMTLRNLALGGLGRTVLPVFLGEMTDSLTRLDALGAPEAVPLWVASHRDVANSPRLRTLRGRIVDGLRARASDLAV